MDKISISKLKDLSGSEWEDLDSPTAVTYRKKIIKHLVDPDGEPTPDPGPDPDPDPDPTPDPDPDPTPTPGGKVSDITGLKWTVMFPFNKPGSTSSPQNLPLKDIEANKDPRTKDYLYMTGSAATFKCVANGAHSPNSQYPRTELREMKDEAWTNGSWASTGTHSLKYHASVSHNFVAKPEVVVGQIHDGNDDVCQIKLEGQRLLFVHNDGGTKLEIDPNYTHGTAFHAEIRVEGGQIKFFYNGVQKSSVPKSGSGWYFKLGNYPQTNPDKGDAPDSFSIVKLFSAKVTHA